MNPELLEVGVAGVVIWFVLDKVIGIVKTARGLGGDSRQELMRRMVEAQERLGDVVSVKNGFNARLEAQAAEQKRLDVEVIRLRDAIHQIRRDFQTFLNGRVNDPK